MCIKSYQHYTKCDHVSTTFTNCPTFRKQQKSAEGLLGRLFHRGPKKKNCGKVFPHHLKNETYCQSCMIKKGRLTAQQVGQGALRVKQGFRDVFQEERREAARASLRNSGKSRLRSKGSNHDVIHAENSVWLGDLYYHPETLAKNEAYARAAAPAPPVSSHSRHPEKDSRAGTRQSRPAPPIPIPTRVSSKPLNLPPAVGSPPRQDTHSRTQPTQRPHLRHKTGQVYNSAKMYQVYLDGMATETAKRAMQRLSSAPTREPIGRKSSWEEEPKSEPKSYWEEEEPDGWDAKKAQVSSWIKRTGDKR
ncbi:hypothetical protein F5Y14DRAFT_139399 [Nemania sp. NC0429]|nr:hypothetical protein F5Y14DRAFT_139399 [Nemania sp. NC0429]